MSNPVPQSNDRSPPTPKALGQHLLVDLYRCRSLPDTAEQLQQLMETAARMVGATIVQSVFHEFEPHGLSGVVVIAESHLSIHVWPEFLTASLDFFSCSEQLDPTPGVAFIQKAFQAEEVNVENVMRGSKLSEYWP